MKDFDFETTNCTSRNLLNSASSSCKCDKLNGLSYYIDIIASKRFVIEIS